MIVSTGIDLVEISRIEEIFLQRGNRFRDRVFTPDEIDYCESVASRFASYAARFAAKEAAMKALGTGWAEGVAWREIEVVRDERGSPKLKLSGRALERMKTLGATRAHISLTHSRNIAAAQVVLEE
ncbi:MAG: holo-ACP synthase [Acidobacteriota bacterium]